MTLFDDEPLDPFDILWDEWFRRITVPTIVIDFGEPIRGRRVKEDRNNIITGSRWPRAETVKGF